MGDKNTTKPPSSQKATTLASAFLSAGIAMGGTSPAVASPLSPQVSHANYARPIKNGDINALYQPHYTNVLSRALDHFNNLAPELAHAYMITLESGWDHWKRDKKGNQIIYTGDPNQLPPKNKICDPAKDLPLIIGQPLPKISSACAIGLTQVIPRTAQSSLDRYNLPYTLQDVLYNPKVNYLAGHLYFLDVRNNLKNKYPSFNGLNTLTATAYNMGEGNQNSSFTAYGTTPGSTRFDLRTYLATMRIEETKEYVPHILAQNNIIQRSQVAGDADGSWFNRKVDALTSYQQLRAGMSDFTTYFARSHMPFRAGESYLGNSMVTVDPSQNRFRVDPSQNSFKVDPSQNSFRVNPSAIPTPAPE